MEKDKLTASALWQRQNLLFLAVVSPGAHEGREAPESLKGRQEGERGRKGKDRYL